MPSMDWNQLADKAVSGTSISEAEAAAVLGCPDAQILAVLDAAFRVRRETFGTAVKLNYLINVKSGLCPEDCSYCSQSKISKAEIEKYPFLSEDEILKAADRAVSFHAKRFCMVNSGRGPTDGELKKMCSAVEAVKERHPDLKICNCLGIISEEQAEALKRSGVDIYNHNLNTSKEHHKEIVSTHSYEDRLNTISAVKEAGLACCSGGIFGIGETDADIVKMAFAVKSAGADSIPLNFLIPVPGTSLENKNDLTPHRCLKILCLFRFVNPKTEIRIAGGREHHLRSMQAFGLYPANSIFVGDYLTTQGQKPEDDIAMIRDMGFEIEGEGKSVVQSSVPFTVRLK